MARRQEGTIYGKGGRLRITYKLISQFKAERDHEPSDAGISGPSAGLTVALRLGREQKGERQCRAYRGRQEGKPQSVARLAARMESVRRGRGRTEAFTSVSQ